LFPYTRKIVYSNDNQGAKKMTEDTKTPIPGDFISPPGPNEPRLPRKEKEDSPAGLAEQLGELQEEMNAPKKEVKPTTPEELEEQYKEGLEGVGLDITGARAIMEGILIKNFYEESYRIGPLPIKLRTRTYSDTLRAQQHLEVENPTYNMSVNDLVARYNVAASLSQYGDRKFEFPEEAGAEVEKAFQQRLAFVMARPAIVMAKLMELAYKFDIKMAAVFAEGAPQDF
jgi:hypothetical protein